MSDRINSDSINNTDVDVSLIVPVYNGKNGIDNLLDSVLSQDGINFEVIFLDDGSVDDSVEYIKSRLNNSNKGLNFRVISQSNKGVAYTRNRGIKEAKGKYIMFADHDDKFLPVYCLVYYNAVAENDLDIVVGGYERVRTDGKVINKVSLTESDWSKYIVPTPWAHIYKKSFLIENEISFLESSIGEDIYFNFIAYSKTDRIKTIPDTSYKWMFNPNSVSNSKQNTINEKVDPIYLMDRIYNDIENISFRDNILMEYFFARYACWFMLFSSRGSKKGDIRAVYSRLHKWLENHYPNYKNNPYLGLKMPKGEIKNTHWFVFIYYLLFKLHLLPGVLTLFGV